MHCRADTVPVIEVQIFDFSTVLRDIRQPARCERLPTTQVHPLPMQTPSGEGTLLLTKTKRAKLSIVHTSPVGTVAMHCRADRYLQWRSKSSTSHNTARYTPWTCVHHPLPQFPAFPIDKCPLTEKDGRRPPPPLSTVGPRTLPLSDLVQSTKCRHDPPIFHTCV